MSKIDVGVMLEMAAYSSQTDIAAACGVTRQAVQYWVRKGVIDPPRRLRNGTAWSDGEDDIIRAGLANGETARVIASRLRGRNRNMVIGRIHRLKKHASASCRSTRIAA